MRKTTVEQWLLPGDRSMPTKFYDPDFDLENLSNVDGHPLRQILKDRWICVGLDYPPLRIGEFPDHLIWNLNHKDPDSFVFLHGPVAWAFAGLPYYLDGTGCGSWWGDFENDVEITAVTKMAPENFSRVTLKSFMDFETDDLDRFNPLRFDQTKVDRLRLNLYDSSNWVPPFWQLKYRKHLFGEPWEKRDGIYHAFDIHLVNSLDEFVKTYVPFFSSRFGYPLLLGSINTHGELEYRNCNPFTEDLGAQKILISQPETFDCDTRSILNISRGLVMMASSMLVTGEEASLDDRTISLMRRAVLNQGRNLSHEKAVDTRDRTGKSIRRIEAIQKVGKNKYQVDQKRLDLFKNCGDLPLLACEFLNSIGYSRLIFGRDIIPTDFLVN